MEVTVVSSRGSKLQLALDPNWSVTQLKKELHTRLPALNIPSPEEQKLVNAYGRLLHGDDENEPISTFCKPGDDLVVLSRRKVQSSKPEEIAPASGETQPPVSLAQVNAAIKEENERLAALGEPLPTIAPSPPPAAGRADAADRLEGSIRALVEGNFEQLRGYLEQLQEAVARQGIGGDEIMFGMPGDDDDEEEMDDEGMDEDEDDEDEEGGAGLGGAAAMMGGGGDGDGRPVQIPQVEEAPLAELLAMGFPEQLSRNALLLHRNRLQPAVDWALSHVDDPQGNEPLAEDVLAAVYGPQRRLGGPGGAVAMMARRRPRLPPGQVDPGTLDSMVEMGFDRDQSARALACTGNRLEDACQLIINGMPLPPLPEQHPQPAAADAAGAGGEGGNAGEAAAAGAGAEGFNPAAVVGAADAVAQAAGQAEGQGGGNGAEVMHDDEEEEHDEDEDEPWESDEDDDAHDVDAADIEHAMDLMFGGLGSAGGGGGDLHPGAVDWMAEEEGWHSEDDGDYSDEEDEDDDGFDEEEGFHDAAHAMHEGEGAEGGAGAGAVPPAPGAEVPPEAPAQGDSQSQPHQPAPSSGNGEDKR